MVLAIGRFAALSMAVITEVWRHQQIEADKALSALTDESRQLLRISRTNDYREAVRLLRQLRLVDETGLARLNSNIWNFDLKFLFKALSRFWHLRWPKLSAAKRTEEISRVAGDFIMEFSADFSRLETDLIAVVRQRHSDIARLLLAEISKQLKEER